MIMHFKDFPRRPGKPAACLALVLSVAAACAQTNLVVLTDGHADIRIVRDADDPDGLGIVVGGETRDVAYPADTVLFRVPEDAAIPGGLPAGTPFGEAGEPFWVLPQSQDARVLFLGISAEGLAEAGYAGFVDLTLVGVEGPGDFFVWQADSVSGLNVKMNSADGIDETDRAMPFVGSHEHANWGFNAPGTYRVTFQASAMPSGGTNRVFSPETSFAFQVGESSPYDLWRLEHWPSGASETITGPGADPDGDGIPNLAEYAMNLDPNVASRDGLPRCSFVREGGMEYGSLSFTKATRATDLAYEVRVSDEITGASWSALTTIVAVEENGDTERVTVRDEVPVAGRPRRFYRLDVRFK